ncbi:right-handed parallel beta-helix repeat-containing protein [Qipengyuania atrilutea]|uniref:Right handed beta helix domain-containing protein n=1 Tax=Qipengyuania atrilutea TaxID=2744473 RepID=A0A850H1K5_9SPHN|nr:right-handed parallel beta-helix repeat-containing protein [Actirhodobacter atriluteus]NVD44400.1 hypothetical protein [Actirhodobacter atriluteus]
MRRTILQFMSVAPFILAAGSDKFVTRTVYSTDELEQLSISRDRVQLNDKYRSGIFIWRTGNFSDRIKRDSNSLLYVRSALKGSREGAWVREGLVATPEMLANGKRLIDHTALLQELFELAGEGVTLRLDGAYHISAMVAVANRSKFVVEGRGSITVKGGTPVAYGFGMLYFSQCTGFKLMGLTLDAARDTRQAAEVHAHSVTFQSCHEFSCIGLRVRNAVCDGIFLYSAEPAKFDTHCSDFLLKDCSVDGSYRQGCSIIEARNGVIDGGHYSGTQGTAPGAGIDLESDAGAPDGAISDITLKNVDFAQNDGFGVLVATVASPRNIKVLNCSFRSNRLGAISFGAESGFITGSKITGFLSTAFRGAIDFPAAKRQMSAIRIRVVDTEFADVASAHSEAPLIYVHENAYAPVEVDTLVCKHSSVAIARLGREGSALRRAYITAHPSICNHAIALAGNETEFTDNTIVGSEGAVLVVVGQRTLITRNQFREIRHTDWEGAIRVIAPSAIIEKNYLQGNGEVALRLEAISKSIRENEFDGFSTAVVRSFLK